MTAAALDEAWIWPGPRAGEALVALADAAELEPRSVDLGVPTSDLAPWLDEAARWLGIEAVAVEAPVAQVGTMIAASTPVLLRLETGSVAGVVAVLSVRRGRAQLLTPDGARTVALDTLVEALCAKRLQPARDAVAQQLEPLGLRGQGARRASDALVAARTRGMQIGGVISLRLAPGAPLRQHARAHRLLPRFVAVALAHAGAYVAALIGWWAIGRGALSGRLDAGWLAAWALLLLTAVVINTIGTWAAGRLSIDSAALIKQRLLEGALRAELDALRSEGIGMSLARVFEATAVERLTINGGFLALFAAIELVVAAVVLGVGAGGLVHVALLGATLAVTALSVRRFAARRRTWTERRLEITHELIEVMIGHATRLAQQPAGQRHEGEDRALHAYTTRAAEMDRTLAGLVALVPRGWLVIAAAGLAPMIVSGGVSPESLAIALGGMLLARSALVKLTHGAAQLVSAAIAWRSIEPLLAATTKPVAVAPPGMALAVSSPATPAATVRGVVYRPARRAHAVLSGCDLTIERGARLLLEGPSGAGKSTLAAMIAGLRKPDGGLVLAGGLDHASVGATGWRRRVACAPQFHENHLFSATLAFNLLLGRAWPPTFEDVSAAIKLCRELGLRDLLERMPAGIMEVVGETGWQLSHGERCRVYLARALLQRAPLVVLDESLAALDPKTLQTAIECIERHADAALVIAHP